MLSLKQGEIAVKLARRAIECYFKKKKADLTEKEKKAAGKVFSEKRGVFVTIHSYPDKELRGCIGLPYPVMPLKEAIIDAARSSAFQDPRFMSLEEKELNKIIIELSVLTPPKKIEGENNELIRQVEIGKDGLICSFKGYSGLLLPQVAIEEKWNSEKFLEQTCVKAGLSLDTWKKKECSFKKFQAQIFIEEKPKGHIKKV